VSLEGDFIHEHISPTSSNTAMVRLAINSHRKSHIVDLL